MSKQGRRSTVQATLAASGLVVAGVGFAVTGPAAQAAGEQCQGQDATIVATADAQTLTGTDGADVIHTGGFTGVKVKGGGGADIICAIAGTRADLDGGEGDDVLVDVATGAGTGRGTKIFAGPGKDQFTGVASTVLTFEKATAGVTVDLAAGTVTDGGDTETVTGINRVRGSAFADTFTGTAAADVYVSSIGPSYATDGDTIRTGGGNDTVTAYGGTVDAGSGSDRVLAYAAVVEGGSGRDTIDQRYGGTANGGSGADVLTAASSLKEGGPVTALPSVLNGGAGNDVLSPVFASGAGKAFVRGTVDGGEGNDILSLVGRRQGIVDLQSGESGRVRVAGGRSNLASIEYVRGSGVRDIIRGDDGPNRISGNGGDDAINGRDGNDILDGGPGRDVVKGGLGNDVCRNAERRVSC
ncbi:MULTISPECIES: calcium-binding protein [Nocardioides]|uniref:Hemolysin-type calcium-binding repeat-containing protein n=1 Tax=Nocardioides lianchengensis TaxID=1045774 RepID=A0A1G6NP80_9ACTN|nr:calcium-binding protein [Nocardioides lianchengensis]NYG10843.1 Ca2+-binding RTX toxin-like protein [Nocardioides lianchengensis]SDC69703.1 Hemolysin-type calcium-binding repeat-containing protein [Nocardioides lianchengensis]